MKDIIRSYKVYPVWEFEQEEQDLNNASQKGLQLIRGGCFHSLFRYDDTVRYIYQLDYQPGLSDKSRYLDMFEAQDWEYVNSTWNGWHYFRKPYEENMREEDCHIYTDRTSLQEMKNRYARLLLIVTLYLCIMGPICLMRGIHFSALALILEGITTLIMACCTGYGVYATRCQLQERSVPFSVPARILLPLCMVLLVISLILLFIS